MTTSGRAIDRRRDAMRIAMFVLLAVLVFGWAKWNPYWHKLPAVAHSGTLGKPVVGGAPLGWFSLADGRAFTVAYVRSVWPAIVAGLVVAAGVQTLIPAGPLARLAGGRGGAVRSALAGIPTMLCTCCAAPIAVGLRNRQVPIRAALAFWLANPLLNPVVVGFAVFVLSPRWAALRLGLGVLVLIAVLLVVGRLRGAVPIGDAPPQTVDPGRGSFVRALVSLTVRLTPVYLALVFLLGALRGTLLPLGGRLTSWGVLGVLVVAVAGTLLAVPTGAEVAVVAALLAAGAPAWLAAPLLITLPATSLPSLAMAWRSFPHRVEVAVAGVTLAGGLLAAVLGATLFG
jgi:uncharacterized membrane protein YraQ (UPF0718 family)